MALRARTLLVLLLLTLSSVLAGTGQQAPAKSIDEAHGSIHHESYATKYVKGLPDDLDRYVVYTPPHYDANLKPGYPVLYLMHGWGGKSDAWINAGHVDEILDQQIALGKTKPMIVVMPLAYGDMSFLTNGFEVWRDQVQIANNAKLFEETLLKEIMPLVERSYDVEKDRNHRAIAGLSMGGLEALTIGLRHADLFAYVGGFSSTMFPIEGADLTNLQPQEENLRLLWISCGTQDDLLSINRIFEMHLREQKIPVTVVETPGRHEWAVWRDNLRHFAPLLFEN